MAALPASAGTVSSGYDTATSTGSIGPSSGPGGAITREQIIARANDWISNQVPYSQSEGWQDGSVGGPYRMDCSGFVSMAWGLPTSMVTSTLPSVATVTSTNIYGDTNINPGDAIDYTADHVVLFDSWISQSAGTFTYDAEHITGQVTNQSQGSIYASTLEGYSLSDYETLQYDNLTTSQSGGTSTPQLSTSGNFTGDVSAIQNSSGAISLYARGKDGNIYGASQAAAGGAFGAWAVFGGTGDGGTADPSVILTQSGTVAIYTTDTAGDVVGTSQSTVGGPFASWAALSSGGSYTGRPAVIQNSSGAISLYARGKDGNIYGASQAAAGSAFTSWINIGGTPPAAAADNPVALLMPNGTVALYVKDTNADIDGTNQNTVAGPFGNWLVM